MATLYQMFNMSFGGSSLVTVGKWTALVVGFGYGTALRNERQNALTGGLRAALSERDAKIRELLTEKKYGAAQKGDGEAGSGAPAQSSGDPLTDWINSMVANN
ncbi:hypothetical protein FVE85_0202 [Porphyridium purpureum]|uniref:Uncharacterized protein n=1 Tax=Porphyridium purpureum TaxID=35688 RepID=A0A5J4Z0U6_PORPP|nr:hypothetical protein FVE85_0202 [Porphyridium purpureum]|eukprot:POR0935..scf208_2